MRKHNQLKQFVYALFTQEQEKSSYEIRNCLISFVDQPGLEHAPADSTVEVRVRADGAADAGGALAVSVADAGSMAYSKNSISTEI